jgi:hypothetical protein
MTNTELELKEAKEDALRYRTKLEEERSARASLYKEVEALKYRLSVAAIEVTEVQAAFGYGTDEELWRPGTTLGESVTNLVEENRRLKLELNSMKYAAEQWNNKAVEWSRLNAKLQAVIQQIRPILDRAAANRKFMQIAQPARECLNIIKTIE